MISYLVQDDTMCGHDKILYVVFIILSAGLFTLKTDFTNSTTLFPDVYEKKKKFVMVYLC